MLQIPVQTLKVTKAAQWTFDNKLTAVILGDKVPSWIRRAVLSRRCNLGAVTVYIFRDGARIVHESGAMFETMHKRTVRP